MSRGVVVLFGGSDGNPVNDTWIWDGTNWHPIETNDAPNARFCGTFAWNSGRQTLVLGQEFSFGATSPLLDAWEWKTTGTAPYSGTWTEVPVSTRPNLRGFGAWQENARSTPMIAKHLLSADEPQMVLLSDTRYQEFLAELSTNRQPLLAEAARFAGADPATLAERLERQPVGLVPLSENTLLLPGPFAICGHDRVRLISR